MEVQEALGPEARVALADTPWTMTGDARVGGCFVAFARGATGRSGDRGWAAAVVWRATRSPRRRGDDFLRGSGSERPRRALDVDDQVVVEGEAGASYEPGLLALRDGPILGAAVARLARAPDVLLVDATGLDHPRRAGLALHLGAVAGVPSVGVTRRPLLATGALPPLRRGATSDVVLDGDVVGRWVCTKSGTRPLLAHAAWRTDAATAAEVVLAVSTESARTPVPLQEARRVAREARAAADVTRAVDAATTPPDAPARGRSSSR